MNALAPTHWRCEYQLTAEERRTVEEYFQLLLRGELQTYRIGYSTKNGGGGHHAQARSDLEAEMEAARLGPEWTAEPVDAPPGIAGWFRPVGIIPAIDLYGPDGERWRGPILPQRETCLSCGDPLRWIYTGQPVDVEYGECDRCAPRMQVAWRRTTPPLGLEVPVQMDLFAGVPL